MPRSSDRRAAGAEEVADALIAEGNRAEHAGELQRARELYERAVETAPDYAKAHLNLGTALEAEGRAQAASVAYERAFALDPRDPYVCYNLGKAVRGIDPGRADELLRAALAARAPFPEALVVLAEVSESQGRANDALDALREALRQRPDYAGAWHNCGLLLRRLERLDEAEDAFRSAIAFDPGLLASRHSLAILLRQEGRVAEAAATLAAARQLAPDNFHLESTQIHTLAYLDTVAPEELFRRHRDFGARLEAVHPERFRPFTNVPDPDRKLRIGYVSSDFNLHPVSLFVLPLLENHDRAAYRVHGYSTGARRDAVTAQIRERCDEWLDADALTDEALAEAVHRDRVDVLIDLTGHAGPMRLAMFAQRPAPVAASWLGYLGTTGLKRVGYRISDAYADPEGLTEPQHTESIVRLPHSQWCYRPVLDREHASEAPRARNGFVTFGSFNHASKVSSSVRSLWARILTKVPRSRLLLAGVPEGRARAAMAAEFSDARLAAGRVQFTPRVAMDRYFQLYEEVDIALDTTPYGGGATTCDALWMGVPVVTLAGPRSVSRSAASILTTLGLERWIARAPDEYVEVATRAAEDPSRVAAARASLRERMRGSPLMDERAFARGFEDACRRMWRAWCADASRGRAA